jgi:hypothetical protein
MERTRQKDLDAWMSRPGRKPLILCGARQVGKSYLVESWGEQGFQAVIEVNLERRPELAQCFVDNDPRASLRRLEVVLGQSIPSDGSALLFLDEIQAAPLLLAKLRWFAEELPGLPLIGAGSLLDFALRSPAASMPVGRITFLHLEPLGFEEFCLALEEKPLVRWLRNEVDLERIAAGNAVPDELHRHALALFRTWCLVGGMPAAVEAYRVERSLLGVATIQRDLLTTLRDDFAKYSGRVPHDRLRAVLDSVPQQLGSKFTYRRVDREGRASALERAVELLSLARVCHRCPATPGRGVPLAAGADESAFKLLHHDVGLVSTSLGLGLMALEGTEDLVLVNQGALAEQAVGQLLRLTFAANDDPRLFWWRREKRGSEAELDYVHALGSQVIPIEVKAGKTGTLKSLHAFMAERGLELALRFNSAPPSVHALSVSTPLGEARYRLLSLPVYLVEQSLRLLGQAMKR